MDDKTRLLHLLEGKNRRTVNPPVERASTVIHQTRQELYSSQPGYGRMGLSVHRELEEALCILENANYAKLTSNGLQACALAIASVVKPDDHILISDSLYGPALRFCLRRLGSTGVSATRFSPLIGADIARLVTPNTSAIYLESPGSLTFDISDTRTIAEIAQKSKIVTISDNTWGTGLLHRPLDLGIDISVQALTKYPVGHADALGGAVMTKDETLASKIEDCADDWGISLAPDDAALALRGLRTIPTRLAQHEDAGYTIAEWLTQRPEVDYILHPGRPDHPEHALWKRDFSGANGLFGVVLNKISNTQLDAFLERLNLFRMGFSWGGYESLLIPCCDQLKRLPEDRIHQRKGPLLRIHAGLENVGDLLGDLEQAFAAMS